MGQGLFLGPESKTLSAAWLTSTWLVFFSLPKQSSFCFLGGKQHLTEAIPKQCWATACSCLFSDWTENKTDCWERLVHFMLFAVHSLHPQSDWVLYLVNPNPFRTWKSWCLKLSVFTLSLQAMIGVAFSLGFTLGPMLGAYLAMHTEKGEVFYLRSALSALVFSVADLIFIFLLLPETLPKEKRVNGWSVSRSVFSVKIGLENCWSTGNNEDKA